ncbi:uncharacterized protein LOC126696027 [Quercus robur]|uniref:uncharacterized protein LOC126696027 n=1 Tax=Quercus robur TaxID=38942 RepID=UPI002163F2FD|nr:uncharacterized protein LOC126696027 [Quercus robur]
MDSSSRWFETTTTPLSRTSAPIASWVRWIPPPDDGFLKINFDVVTTTTTTTTTPLSRTSAPIASWVTWIPPPDGFLKINFDVVTFKDTGKAGLGIAIRSCQGKTIASLFEQTSLPHSSDIVKAMAAARAISFAHELDFSSFTLEGDYETVIKALKSDVDSLTPFGHYLASAKATTDANSCISFSHIHRLDNFVDYNLPKHARYVRDFLV